MKLKNTLLGIACAIVTPVVFAQTETTNHHDYHEGYRDNHRVFARICICRHGNQRAG